jgi:transcriptional regulator with XRE-family HTH domain
VNTIYMLKTLKAELKKAKITYRDLAKELKISEAGIKKLFSKSDLSLKRALQICEVLNLPFSEIVSLSENSRQSEVHFTEKQIQFFKSNIHFFHFYMKIAYEQMTPHEIQRELGLSSKSLNIYLKKLEDLGLIKRHPRDRVQIIGGAPLAVNTGGTELESVKFDIAQDLLKNLRKSQNGNLFGGGLYLTNDEAHELKEKLFGLMKTYSTLSASHRKNPKSQASPLSVMILYSPTSMFNHIRDL